MLKTVILPEIKGQKTVSQIHINIKEVNDNKEMERVRMGNKNSGCEGENEERTVPRWDDSLREC